MAELTAAGPVLVHFIDYAQLNSVRTLPYLREWKRRYGDLGLSVILVQTPRLAFGAEPDAARAAGRRLALEMPIALDADRALWRDYGCEGWPSLFLWAQGGALHWFHFGEGEYRATEEAIQAELREVDALRKLPAPLAPVRPSDAPGAKVIAPTPELFPAENRAWTAKRDEAGLTVEYEGAGAHVTVEGKGRLRSRLDGTALAPVEVPGPGLYTLAEHETHGRHTIEIRLDGKVALWAVSFSPGVPAAAATASPR